MEKQGASAKEMQRLVPGDLSKLLETGDIDSGILSVGQVVGLVHDIPTVKQLIDRIVQEAEEVTSRLSANGRFQALRKPVEAGQK
jgi:nitronate monooxygenase